jgi:hypothetical protein
MVFAMVVAERPISSDARFKDRFQARLQAHARRRFAGQERLDGALYIRILWLHRLPTNQDIDNIAKRIVDALKGVIYDDDHTIESCLTRKILYTPDTIIYSGDEDAPPGTIDELASMIARDEPHILYVEVGRSTAQQITFGPAY